MTQESLLSAHRLSVRLVPGGDRSAPGPLSKGHNPACTASYRLHHLKFNHKTHFSKDLGTPCFSLNSFRLGSGAEGGGEDSQPQADAPRQQDEAPLLLKPPLLVVW